MQLGTRWRAGDAPHRSVPPVLHDSIARAEAEHPRAGFWTLTWLEGRPRCALDELLVLVVRADGAVTRENAGESVLPAAPSETGGIPEEDDDDWLG